ncbi:hypothetical protein X975_14672, partial [Stegodyphus mimosarum]
MLNVVSYHFWKTLQNKCLSSEMLYYMTVCNSFPNVKLMDEMLKLQWNNLWTLYPFMLGKIL